MSRGARRICLTLIIALCGIGAGAAVYAAVRYQPGHFYGLHTFFVELLFPTVGVVFLMLALALVCIKRLREL
jgi:hypothetical protein